MNVAIPNVEIVPGLETLAKESFGGVVVAPDELTIYGSSSIDSDAARIWVATRTAKTLPFTNGHIITELDARPSWQVPSYISADGCRLYYAKAMDRATPRRGRHHHATAVHAS